MESIIKNLIIDDDLVIIVDDLVEKADSMGDKEFAELFKNIPFNYYYTVDRLSESRSSTYRDLCDKARIITNKFHKTFK